MMRILMILNVLVMLLQCQRNRREVVRSHDGLFYHQGPYLSHNRQFTRQAPAPFHRPPLLQTQPHHSTPVRFPQQHFAATGGPTQAINGHFIPHTTHQEQSFIGPAPPPQPHQPLLPLSAGLRILQCRRPPLSPPGQGLQPSAPGSV